MVRSACVVEIGLGGWDKINSFQHFFSVLHNRLILHEFCVVLKINERENVFTI